MHDLTSSHEPGVKTAVKTKLRPEKWTMHNFMHNNTGQGRGEIVTHIIGIGMD